MKRYGIILLFILIFGTFVSAIDIIQIDPINPQNATVQERDIALLQRIASLENKLENLTTKADLTTSTTFLYNELYKEFRNKTDFLILTSVMIDLFIIGLAFGIYFTLKARRRI